MTEIIVLILRNLHKVLSQTNLQHNLLHFFIRTLKLTNQDQHNFSGVVVGILCIHKRDQVPNGFEKSSKTLKNKKAACQIQTQTLKKILLFPFSFPFTQQTNSTMRPFKTRIFTVQYILFMSWILMHGTISAVARWQSQMARYSFHHRISSDDLHKIKGCRVFFNGFFINIIFFIFLTNQEAQGAKGCTIEI